MKRISLYAFLLLLTVFGLLLISCDNKTLDYLVKNKKGVSLNYEVSTLNIPLDSSTLLNEYVLVTPYCIGKENYLLAYNDAVRCFDFFSLREQKLIKQTV
jgi:hypothetical protein